MKIYTKLFDASFKAFLVRHLDFGHDYKIGEIDSKLFRELLSRKSIKLSETVPELDNMYFFSLSDTLTKSGKAKEFFFQRLNNTYYSDTEDTIWYWL